MIPLIITIAIALLALVLLDKSRKMLAEATAIYDRAIAAQARAIKLNAETIAIRMAMLEERL